MPAGTDIAFTLDFTKARRRKPSNRSDFQKVAMSMVDDVWSTTAAPTATKPPRLHDEAETLLRHMRDALASGVGGIDRPMPGMPAVPTLTRSDLQNYLVRQGWLQTELSDSPEKSDRKFNDREGLSVGLSSSGKETERVPNREHTRLWKRLNELKVKGLAGFDKDKAWLASRPAGG